MWALCETAFCAVFQVTGGRVLRVHRNGSVHALRRRASLESGRTDLAERRVATAPTVLPSSKISRTAPIRNSSLNCRRARLPAVRDPMLDIVSTFRNVSTKPDQAHADVARNHPGRMRGEQQSNDAQPGLGTHGGEHVGVVGDGIRGDGICSAPGFLDSGLKVITSTLPRPARRNRVALGLDSDSRTSPASTARCTSVETRARRGGVPRSFRSSAPTRDSPLPCG